MNHINERSTTRIFLRVSTGAAGSGSGSWGGETSVTFGRLFRRVNDERLGGGGTEVVSPKPSFGGLSPDHGDGYVDSGSRVCPVVSGGVTGLKEPRGSSFSGSSSSFSRCPSETVAGENAGGEMSR